MEPPLPQKKEVIFESQLNKLDPYVHSYDLRKQAN